MARGFTCITFVGGKKDGQVIDNVSLRGLPKQIHQSSDRYFTETPNGVAVAQGTLDANWLSYSIGVYEKQPNQKYQAGVIFQFVGTEEITRCEAITKKNVRCTRPAKIGLNYCNILHKTNPT